MCVSEGVKYFSYSNKEKGGFDTEASSINPYGARITSALLGGGRGELLGESFTRKRKICEQVRWKELEGNLGKNLALLASKAEQTKAELKLCMILHKG